MTSEEEIEERLSELEEMSTRADSILRIRTT
jgi:hypothetical protein